jgi:hypothetical protein
VVADVSNCVEESGERRFNDYDAIRACKSAPGVDPAFLAIVLRCPHVTQKRPLVRFGLLPHFPTAK